MKRVIRVAIILSALLTALLCPPFAGSPVYATEHAWTTSSTGGFLAGADSPAAVPLAHFQGKLYAGVANEGGAQVWVKDDGSADWSVLVDDGFGSSGNLAITRMEAYDGYLYAGTANMGGCQLWRYDGTAWTDALALPGSGGASFGDQYNLAVTAMEVYDGKLYVGLTNYEINISSLILRTNGVNIWRYDGSAWDQVDENAFDGTNNDAGIGSFAVYGGYLYATTIRFDVGITWPYEWDLNRAKIDLKGKGCQLWRTDGTGTTLTWTMTADNGFGKTDNLASAAMCEYGGNLYISTVNGTASAVVNISTQQIEGDPEFTTDGLSIYSYSGSGSPAAVVSGGFGSADDVAVACMERATTEDGVRLLAGVGGSSGAGKLMAFDGTAWTADAPAGFGNPDNAGIASLAVFDEGGKDAVYAGTLNITGGCEVWQRVLTHTITASAGSNGSITPSGAVSVVEGEDQAFTITPATGYHVEDVLVDGSSAGAPTSYTFEDVQDDHTIAASFAINTYTLSTGQDGSGTVGKVPGQALYDHGASVRLTAYPDPGWHFVEWTGDLTGSANPADLVMDSNKTVVAHFSQQYVITAFADPLSGGSVTGSGTYDQGATATLTADPAPHWHFVNWTEGGTEVSTDATYSFTVDADRTLTAHFAVDTFTVYTSAGAGGSITPSDEVIVEYGADQVFDIIPDTGWHVADVVVDGVSVGAVDSYEFKGVTSDHTIAASFASDLSTWYLAEGSTDWGFDCYVSVVNPNEEAVSVKLTYMTSTGPVAGPTVNMPALSQATVFPSATLGARDFSTKVECTGGQAISVDRTMYWTGAGAPCAEAHCATGVTAPASTWYMPEGSSNWGFECWLLIQNPNPAATQATVTWMIEGASPRTNVFLIPANSRATYNMADYIGAQDASIKVSADKQVICERAMYRNNRREGHDSGGTTTPAVDYYLAEGCTGFGFTTYVLVQNPQSTPTEVTVTYQAASGPVAGPTFTMPANSRKTVNVNDSTAIPGPDPSFSTHVHGSAPIIAERAMYWNGGSDYAQVCHDSIGLDQPHATWYLADGQSSDGRETWTLVQNPNASAVTVRITYMPRRVTAT